ncbi:hypothetical protein DYB36_002112 [Aphanomyces astaci]|uniref:EGF-like domain-containing protein n=1 Tax=Aphanomyces astaci TaxID=112090 RepID=A0A397AXA4_APHAT|nr:hypothetical protein DYB36_002112 [Aphanomyces astaci]
MRHVCSSFGVQSKCHMCQNDAFQIQGVDWSVLPVNIPTVTDTPFVVSTAVPTHRYDYGHPNVSHVCVLLSGADCLTPSATTSYATCTTRCWGYQAGPLTRQPVVDDATDRWDFASQPSTAQGQVTTVAGSGQPGFQDGPVASAQFSFPRGVAVDSQRNVYVADTNNHRIRLIRSATQDVVTIAGDGVRGSIDGPIGAARFSFPTGIAVLESGGSVVKVYVADTGNHRIRIIDLQSQRVLCLGGRLDGTTTTLAGNVILQSNPMLGCAPPCVMGVAGFRDGNLTYAQFNHPTDITLGPTNTLIIADDHRVRRIVYGSATVQGIASSDRVVTVAGVGPFVAGETDGKADEASLHTTGVAVATDDRVYITSSISVTMYDSTGRAIRSVWQDVDVGTSITVQCPANCNSGTPQVFGTSKYTDSSQICYAAIHAGLMTSSASALLTLTLEANMLYDSLAIRTGSTANGVTSATMPSAQAAARLFSLEITPLTRRFTVAGAPVSLLESPRGYRDGAPPLFAKFQGPTGIDVFETPSSTNLVIVADTTNHRIRGLTAACSKICENQGQCISAETCACAPGWRGDDCTIPVCTPGLCGEWQGTDCRTPVCHQICANGGVCAAPNTCLCPAGWSGHDCAIPVCIQGSFVAHPSGYQYGLFRPFSWDVYAPCEFDAWCQATVGFDCAKRPSTLLQPKCKLLELRATALSHYSYAVEHAIGSTPFRRYSTATPYGQDRVNLTYPGAPVLTPGLFTTPPYTATVDRILASVERRRMTQGVYVCANQGNCTAPDICVCAQGWSGFDCRTPVCTQGTKVVPLLDIEFSASQYVGYYTPTQPTFVSAEPLESKHFNHPPSNGNPAYPQTVETLSWDHYTVATVSQGNTRFLSQGFEAQGGYACSSRSLTQFEKPATLDSPAHYWNFANYFSQYMNDSMYWPPLYAKSPPLWDNTQDGYRRAGIWSYQSPAQWQKGTCLVEFVRTCPLPSPPTVSVDPDSTYRPIVRYSAVNASSIQSFDGCVDYVRRGCFNNGTCVAPDTCLCATGWTGTDCSVPICVVPCVHGVCTLPNGCTCDLGWTGVVCSDTCECPTWASAWRNGRRNGGTPIFLLPDGSPQLTGWTGYDCNTPICTQAQRFLLNAVRDTPTFVAMRGDLHKTPCVHLRCPQYDIELTSNDGTSFQSGCAPGIPYPNPVFAGPSTLNQANWDAYNDTATTGRQSDAALCRVLRWQQGEFSDRVVRLNHPGVARGEGVYECYNKGSCVRPDVCSCADGYTGFDCQLPLCRYTTPAGDVTGCQHHGICISKDTCECIQTQSVLYQKYPLAPRGNTGWAGSTICVQGFYDAQCHGQAPVGHEGCYRCANGGMCVAPDLCQCADGWTGYDCNQPVCKVKVTPEIRAQLFTVDETKVLAFENDPCGTQGGRWGKEVVNGAEMGQGNCTLPYLCTCLCRVRYDYAECKKSGEFCLKPWYDVFGRAIPPGYIFGTKHCSSGFQGLEDSKGRFQSCHLQIYEPTGFQRYTASFVAFMTIACILFMVSFYCIRRNLKRRNLRLKAERRRSRRESEENPLNPEFAFGHQ